MTKTGVDGGVPAPRETARRIPRKVDARDGGGPRAAALRPEGATRRRRAGRGDDGRPRDGRRDRGPRCYSPKGRHSGGARGGATAWTASRRRRGPRATLATARRGDAAAARGSVQPRGRPGVDDLGAAVDRGPRHYGLKGRRSGDAGRCSREENHGAAALRPDGATQRQPVARSTEGRAELGDDLHGTCEGARNRRARSVARRR